MASQKIQVGSLRDSTLKLGSNHSNQGKMIGKNWIISGILSKKFVLWQYLRIGSDLLCDSSNVAVPLHKCRIRSDCFRHGVIAALSHRRTQLQIPFCKWRRNSRRWSRRSNKVQVFAVHRLRRWLLHQRASRTWAPLRGHQEKGHTQNPADGNREVQARL